MSQRYYQVQSDAPYRLSSSRPSSSTKTGSSHRSPSESSTSSSSSSSSYSSFYADQQRYSMSSPQPHVEILRCSRCAKSVETVSNGARGSELRRVSTDDASASGMVRFGHNLYYCHRCAKMVGYQ